MDTCPRRYRILVAVAGLIQAAGAVVFRPGREVLLIHRPKYDDWSFPKGKLDRGEHRTAAAVREVEEETGLRVRLGVPLSVQEYQVGTRPKIVYYWVGRVIGEDDVSRYVPNAEIDQVRWVPVDRAADLLTSDDDRATLADAMGRPYRTDAVVILRHASARARLTWARSDQLRPLLAGGNRQALALVPVLDAYGVTRVVSSSSTRCVQTVEPFATAMGVPLERLAALSEEEADPATIRGLADELSLASQGTVLCTHRPVLPLVYEGFDLEADSVDPPLAPAQLLVLHLRRGRIRAVERH